MSATTTTQKPGGFDHVAYPQPHPVRTKQILAKYPQAKDLFGNYPLSALYVIAIVSVQIGIAIAMRHQPIWINLLTAYLFGAIANHAMWVMIHDASHNLVFKAGWANRVISIVANLPIVFASAVSFQKYHMLHHRYQGEMTYDADLPYGWEAKAIGNSFFKKLLWLFGFFIVEGILRPLRIKHVKPVCRWVVINNLVEYGFLAALTYFAGWNALIYLFLSTFFSIGLHPCGARWIQEHFTYKAGQETYSYYGPLNLINFNIGHHNEHHDLPMISWRNLAKLRAMAPEFYNDLYYHTSYTGLLLSFLFRRDITLYNRVTRDDHSYKGKVRAESVEPTTILAPVPT